MTAHSGILAWKIPWTEEPGGLQSNVVLSHLSRVRLFVTLWTVAPQAPLSMGFSRQEYWSGVPFPFPGNSFSRIFPTQNSNPHLLISCIGRRVVFFFKQLVPPGLQSMGYKESDMTEHALTCIPQQKSS